ncbi:hypothetical protein VZT92_008502 [Zoarces viviparus]|uniref:Uncharacterized protein n=1 Tax=Zoarces viviparus TaxID=48416 RepID=A0AAW1FFZ7_ZOAVI
MDNDVASLREDDKETKKELFAAPALPRRASDFSLFNKFDQNQSFTAVSPFHIRQQPNSHSGLLICLWPVFAAHLSSSSELRWRIR